MVSAWLRRLFLLDTKPTRYLTGPQRRTRYGNRPAVWFWRQITKNPDFPRPLVINGKNYFSEAELDAFDASHRAPLTASVKATSPDQIDLEELIEAANGKAT